MLHFPQGFLWGSSTSGPQSEGRVDGDGKGDNDWDHWFALEPDKFDGRAGPDETATFYTHYREDIDLLVATGHNAFRTSIQWSRLIPDGVGAVNEQAVTFYRDVFQRIRDKGIRLLVNLYHFDLPFALQQKGGWEHKDTVAAYERYAHTCFSLFHDLVDTWITFNEPIVPVECGYLYQYHYPCKVDAKAAVAVAYHTQLASALAVKQCHDLNPQHRIGIVLNLTPAYPRSNHPADLRAARIAELFQAKSFLDPSVKGRYPEELVALLKEHQLLPEYTETELDIIARHTVDFLGVNYYQPLRVCAPRYAPNPEAPLMPEHFYEHYVMPGRKMNPYRGWEIYEQGLYDIAQMIQKEYGNIEWLVTENGMGVAEEQRFCQDGVIEDTYRIDFYKEHLKVLHRAIASGANCRGYLVWTFIDCWSWLNGFKNRYGLVSLDRTTQKRSIKRSGYWFRQLSEQNGFDETS